MISTLRVFIQSLFFKAIMILLVAAFAFWGIGEISVNLFRDNTLAKIDGRAIDYTTFNRQLNRSVERMQLDQLSSRDLIELGIASSVLDQLISHEALKVEADKLDMIASDKAVARILARSASFQDQQGNFSPNNVRQYLQQIGMSEQEFFTEVGDSFRTQIIGDTMGAQTPSFRALARLVKAYEGQKLTFDYVATIPPTISEQASDEELQSLLQDKRERYIVAETRSAEFLLLDPADTLDANAITQSDLENEFAEQKARFLIPERRDLVWKTFDDKDQASAALASAEPIGDGGIARKGIAQDEIPDPVLAKNMFAIKSTGKPSLVEGALGWYVVKVDKITAGKLPKLSSVSKQLRQDLAQKRALDGIYQSLTRIEDGLAAQIPLKELAQELGLDEPKTLANLSSARGLTGGIDAISDLSANEKNQLSQAIFSYGNQEGGVIDSAKGRFIAFQVSDILDASLPNFADVRGILLDDWRNTKAANIARDEAQKIIDTQFVGARSKRISNISRTASDKDAALNLPSELFAKARALTKIGESVLFSDTGGRSYAIILRQIDTPSIGPDRSSLAALQKSEQQIVNADRQETRSQVVRLIEKNTSIERNHEKISDSLAVVR